jgi:tripartite-type tricarboxylate transporter receptor subunit TctC
MKLPRHWMAAVLAIVAFAHGGTARAADEYPARPMKILVGFAAGGPADAVARMMARKLQEQMKQPVVVENKTGADGTVAIEALTRSPPDGYTLLMTQNSITVNPSLYKKVPFNPMTDVAPVAFIGEGTNFVAVTPSLPVRNLQELIDYGRRNPGQLNYAATASANELASELLAQMAGMKMTRISYRGLAPAMLDLMSGQIHLVVSNIGTLLPQVKSGRIRALAVTGLKRSPLAPEVPTVSELGLKGYSATTWYGMLAPAGTPAPVVERLHREINIALQDAEVRKQMADLAVDLIVQSREEFQAFLRDDLEKWKKVVAAAGGPRD